MMDTILKDSRFAKISTDKRFMTVPKKQKKVKIDIRFKSMFEDERFVSKCAVDKRGRPTNYTSKENYKKYYDLKDSDESDSDSDETLAKEDLKLPGKLDSDEDGLIGSFSKTPEVQTATSEDDQSNDDENVDKENVSEPSSHDFDPKVKSKLRDMSVDYARGEATLYSSEEDSSSGEDSSDEEEGEILEVFDKWGELDKDAESTEEITKRLAVCNMNWDRVKAEDIFLVMSSFCPGGGSVIEVRIYMSDFGKERLADEEKLGPKELRAEVLDSGDEVDGDYVGNMDEKMSEAMSLNRVRQYQINKLKYYYAVVEFDTPETANTVYTECDGKEYELSASRFDLRFVPDDMEFDAEPTSSCLTPPTPEIYKPKLFFTTALQQGKVDLTWDENDPARAAAMKNAYQCEDNDIGDVKAFLASESEDDELDTKESRSAPPSDEDSDKDESGDKDAIAKYKALIADIKESEERKLNAKGNLEVSWEENVATDKPREEEEKKELTPWEKYLRKKKDKKAKKREKSISNAAGEGNAISDDDLPEDVDLNDPFFASELEKNTKKEKKPKKKKKASDVLSVEGEETANPLDLIVMDSDDDKNHFDFKQIRETENKDASKSKKKKWSKKNKMVEVNKQSKKTAFNIDVEDDRFSALYSSANYNIDPSDPNFKRTKAMDDLITEKQKRRKEAKSDVPDQNLSKKKCKLDPELSQSLKSVKSKWQKNAKHKRNTFIVKDI